MGAIERLGSVRWINEFECRRDLRRLQSCSEVWCSNLHSTVDKNDARGGWQHRRDYDGQPGQARLGNSDRS